MAYPENLLADDERVVEHLHPHWITLVVPTFLLIVVVAAAAVGLVFLPGGSSQTVLQIVILAVAVVLIVIFWLVPFLRWRTTHYVITTHRVMFRIGILSREGKDIALNRITDVSYEQTLWDRIVNAGNLTVQSAGDSEDRELTNIPHSDRIQQLINRLVEEDEDRRSRDSARHYQRGYAEPGPASPYEPDLQREPTRRYEGR